MSSRKVREMLRLRRIEFETQVEKGRTENMLGNMTKAQLIDYAEYNGIEIDKTAKKAEIIETIKEKK